MGPNSPPTARFLVKGPGSIPASILDMVARGVDSGNPLFGDIFNKLWTNDYWPQDIGGIARQIRCLEKFRRPAPIWPFNVTGTKGGPMAPTLPGSHPTVDAPQSLHNPPSWRRAGAGHITHSSKQDRSTARLPNSNLRPTPKRIPLQGLLFHLSTNTSAGGIPDLDVMRPTALKRHRQILLPHRPFLSRHGLIQPGLFQTESSAASPARTPAGTHRTVRPCCQALLSSASRRAFKASFSSRAF